MEDGRIRKFARFLINKAVYLKPGEKILIELHGHEYALAKALVQEAYKAGGKPYVHIFDYEVEGALVAGADEGHMADVTAYELDRMKNMDAYIDIRATENINAWNGIPAEKMAVYKKEYWGPLHLNQRCNHTKWSVLRYPNNAMAQLAGMSTEEYEDFYFRACLLDYDRMAKAMENIVRRMEKDRRGPYHRAGTDIRFSIKGIGVFP